MKTVIMAGAILALLRGGDLGAQQPDRIQLMLDSSEAEAVLTILDKRAGNKAVTDDDWRMLFSTIPYQRLKKRESSMGRDFTDVEFKGFVVTLDARRGELRQTLEAWEKADLVATARFPLRYLPDNATLHAAVYPVIKPQTNSFVFEASTDPAVFLNLDPRTSAAQFENTVAHELHHIGLASLDAQYEQRIQALPENTRKAARWMGAFGEGIAVLAAADSPGEPPLAAYPVRDLFRVPRAVVHGRISDGDDYREQLGRAVLVETLKDPRQFVARYNDAAMASNRQGIGKVPLFSTEVLEAVSGKVRK